MRPLLRPVLLVVGTMTLAVALTIAATGLLGGTDARTPTSPSSAGRAGPAGVDPAALRDRDNLIGTLQARLRSTPKDQRSWSTLALAYVEQARVTADPTYYGKAGAALARARALAPHDSVMYAATATLEAARHDFTPALRDSGRALAGQPLQRRRRGHPCRRPHRAGPVRRGTAGSAPSRRPRPRPLDVRPALLPGRAARRPARGRPTDAAVAAGSPAPARRRTPSRPSTSASWPAPPASRRSPRTTTGTRWTPTRRTCPRWPASPASRWPGATWRPRCATTPAWCSGSR